MSSKGKKTLKFSGLTEIKPNVLLFGNDRIWMERMAYSMQNVFVTARTERKTVDMALMAKNCSKLFLTTASTFGIWAAILSGSRSTTVFYNTDFGPIGNDFAAFQQIQNRMLPSWTPVNLTEWF